MRISIEVLDITAAEVDAVVNAANDGLWAGGGVCGAIFRAAGMEELTRACRKIGGCPTGSAVITPGFALPARFVIHAVGPIYQDGNHGEADKLYNCYKKSMELAVENGCKTIAFPLISSGIYGYPKEGAWERALAAVMDFQRKCASAPEVVFCVLDDGAKALGSSILARLEDRR